MTAIQDEKYVSLTTYKRNGDPKSLPVWITDLGDGTVGFTTSSSSYKVIRLRNDPRCTLQPCDQRGRIRAGTETVSGTAELRSGAEFEPVRDRIKAKYGIQYTMINAMGSVAKLIGKGSGTDTAVVVTLD